MAKKGVTRVARAAAVRRVISGEARAVIAHEHGLSLQTVHGWVGEWENRGGEYQDKPLEQSEIDLGYELYEHSVYGVSYGTKVRRRDGAPRPDAERALERFCEILHRVPTESREPLLASYQQLNEAARSTLGPALDLYLEASDRMDQVRLLRAQAAALAAREVAALDRERGRRPDPVSQLYPSPSTALPDSRIPQSFQ